MTNSRHQVTSNPFRPGMGLEPLYLADRERQLERFQRYLAGYPGLPRNVRLTGLRGVGKTVLLQQYGRLAEEAGWMVVSRECNEHMREEVIFGQALVDDCGRAVEQSSRSNAFKQHSREAARGGRWSCWAASPSHWPGSPWAFTPAFSASDRCYWTSNSPRL